MKKVLSLFVLAVIGFFLFSHIDVQAQELNAKCWTEVQCKTEFERRVTENGGNAEWDASKYFGLKPDSCPVQHGYCYPPNLEISLLVPLGETRSVAGLGDYVQALTRVLIGFISLSISVMIMVAGLMWMTARGDAGAIKKATSLASKGFFSLIIVLSSVTILQLIDPDLVNLNPLRTPLIKPVNYIDSSVSCESLLSQYKDLGLQVSPGSGNCGTKGQVDLSQLEDGVQVTGLEDGAECLFNGSATDCKGFKSCVQGANNGDFQCVSCGQALDDTGLTATSGLCSSFGASAELAENEIYQCRYIPPDSLISGFLESSGIANSGFCLEIHNGTEARPTISCERMKQAASGLEDPCSVYEDLKLNSTTTWTGAGTWKGELGEFVKGGTRGISILGGYCGGDICGVSPSGCKLSDKTTIYKEEETLITPEREISRVTEYSCISSDKPNPPDEVIIEEAENI